MVRRRQKGWRQISNSGQALIAPEFSKALSVAVRQRPLHWSQRALPITGNNVCERALKKSILHRKNSLFYKTRNGARIGDLFMSLIHTCELNKINPFDYLTELLRHPAELAERPSHWMPWNYRNTLAGTAIPAAA